MIVLFEDNHFIAVYKFAGDLVQKDKTETESLEDKVKEYLKFKYQKPGNVYLGVIHRVDRPVTGVVLFSKTSKALSRINHLFQEKQVKKTYLAITQVEPDPPEDTIIHFLKRDEKKNKTFVYDWEVKDSKKAVLHYKLLGKSDRYYLLEIDLQTGRHHQIRSQLARIGCPIKGDLKYGFPRSNSDGSISLHSYKIAFQHPITNVYTEIIAPLPDDKLWRFFAQQFSFKVIDNIK